MWTVHVGLLSPPFLKSSTRHKRKSCISFVSPQRGGRALSEREDNLQCGNLLELTMSSPFLSQVGKGAWCQISGICHNITICSRAEYLSSGYCSCTGKLAAVFLQKILLYFCYFRNSTSPPHLQQNTWPLHKYMSLDQIKLHLHVKL